MAPTYSIWSTTTIILLDGNVNVVQGNYRYLDRSTRITNTDSYNVLESTVTGLSTTSLAPTDAPYQPVNVAQSMTETPSVDDDHPSPLHQSSIESSDPQPSLSLPCQSKTEERTTIRLRKAFTHQDE